MTNDTTNGTSLLTGNATTTPIPDGYCDASVELEFGKRRWYMFILISLIIWVGGLICIVLGRCFHAWIFNRKRAKEKLYGNKSPSHVYVENGSNWYVLMTNMAGDLESGRNLAGKILVSKL